MADASSFSQRGERTLCCDNVLTLWRGLSRNELRHSAYQGLVRYSSYRKCAAENPF